MDFDAASNAAVVDALGASMIPRLADGTSMFPLPGRMLLERFLVSALPPLLKWRGAAFTGGFRWTPPRQWPVPARTWS